MKLWLLTQNDSDGYDTYDSCIVAAKTEQEAKQITPSEYTKWNSGTWAKSPDRVQVTLLGSATKGTPAGLILSSFTAG